MAKADRKSTPATWEPLHAVQELVVGICLSPSRAGPWLAEQIAAKQVRVQTRAVHPANTSSAEIERFWQGSLLPTLDFADCSATKLVALPSGVGAYPITLFGIEVVREDIEALRLKPTRKAGPGAERIYDHAAFIAAAGTVLKRGRPDTKQVFFDQVRAAVPRGTKLPPEDDNTTLNRVVGKLWDTGKKS
jgi:hypothetical protein